MIRPRGKASRIYKQIFSTEEKMGKRKQKYDARLDESLGERNRGKKKQSLKSRRKESKDMEESLHRRSFASVKSKDKKRRKKK